MPGSTEASPKKEDKMTPKEEEKTPAAPEGTATLATPESDDATKVEIKLPAEDSQVWYSQNFLWLSREYYLTSQTDLD